MNSEEWPDPMSSLPSRRFLLHTAQNKSHLSFEAPPPFCDLSLLFTALCPLDLELQAFTQCTRKRGGFGTCGYYCLYIFISKCLGDSLGGTVLKEKLLESGMEVEGGNALSIAL